MQCITLVTYYNPSTLLTPIPNPLLLFLLVSTAEFLTAQHYISPETALKASSTVSHLKNSNKTNSILSFLKQSGFSLPQIDLIINKYPKILNGNPNNLKKKFQIFQEKGSSMPDTIAIISKNPWVLPQSSKMRMGPSIDVLKATLGSTDSVGRLLKRLSWFLKLDLCKTMIPNIEFLKERSELSSYQITDFVISSPKFFVYRPEAIEDGARRLDEMGLKWTFKMYIQALKVVCLLPEKKFKHRMRFFQELGLSENVVLRMFNMYPNIFCCSEKNMKETIEVLLVSGRADPSIPIKNVKLLMYSLEKRIKPRLEVVKVLDERGLWPKSLSLSSIVQMFNKKFLGTYVLSNSKELGDELVTCISNKLGGKP